MLKFEASGVLREEKGKDGRSYWKLDYLGGSVGLSIGRDAQGQVASGAEVKVVGSIRSGKTGFYLVAEKIF